MEIEYYVEKLGESYAERMHDESKMVFLGEDVFGFTTYENELTESLTGLMLEVIDCILNKTTFDYHGQSREHYVNYILMCNMPFLVGKLEWGTSIRGAWFDYYKKEGYDLLGENVPAADLENFIRAIFVWLKR